ncbi:MAG: MBL fold metallo-hydrolase [Candidatus Helarchaeota archaeon]
MEYIRDSGKISDDSYIIDTKSWGIKKQNAVYFIMDKKIVLIDTGTASDARKINKYIKEEIGCSKIDYLIITHGHLDHYGGLSYFIKRHDPVFVLISNKSINKINEIKELIKRKNLNSKLIEVQEGDKFNIGEMHTLKILETPGHSPDHISIFDLKTRYLYVGDSAGAYHIGKKFSRPTAYAPDFNYTDYLKTLNRFIGMNISGIGISSYGFVKGSKSKGVLKFGLNIFKNWYETIKKNYLEGKDINEIYEIIIDKFGKSPGEIQEHQPESWTRQFLCSSIQGFIDFIENNSK